MSSFLDSAKDSMSSATTKAQEKAHDGKEAVTDAAVSFKDHASSTYDSAKDSMSSATTKVQEKAHDAKEAVTDAAVSFKDHASSTYDSAKDMMGQAKEDGFAVTKDKAVNAFENAGKGEGGEVTGKGQ
ncbi:uncharacterized protein [Littorina saxatilis]|uniref:Uncharacterized protein n=1 Tax=Littorina saxatilis TaxID=31220 RepID=A0AAN9B388_9CAEN